MVEFTEAKRMVEERIPGERPRDPVYLFACYLLWHRCRNLFGYDQLVAALDDNDEEIRFVARTFLQRPSPRPDGNTETAEDSHG